MAKSKPAPVPVDEVEEDEILDDEELEEEDVEEEDEEDSDADADADDDDGENSSSKESDEEEESDNTSAKAKKERAPRGPGVGWDKEKDLALAVVMARIQAGKLKASLTADAIAGVLREHPAFTEVADRLTAQSVSSHVKVMREKGADIPELVVVSKRYDIEDFNKELKKLLAQEE